MSEVLGVIRGEHFRGEEYPFPPEKARTWGRFPWKWSQSSPSPAFNPTGIGMERALSHGSKVSVVMSITQEEKYETNVIVREGTANDARHQCEVYSARVPDERNLWRDPDCVTQAECNRRDQKFGVRSSENIELRTSNSPLSRFSRKSRAVGSGSFL